MAFYRNNCAATFSFVAAVTKNLTAVESARKLTDAQKQNGKVSVVKKLKKMLVGEFSKYNSGIGDSGCQQRRRLSL